MKINGKTDSDLANVTFEYTRFDQNGNWVERVFYQDVLLIGVFEREINYR